MSSSTPDPLETTTDDATPERELAYELLGQESGLWGEILYELLGRPRRYSELKPLLGDQADNTLTYALEKLVDEGLVERTSDVVDDELVKQYAISRKGIDVFLHMHLLETIDQFVATSGAPRRRETQLQAEVQGTHGVIANLHVGRTRSIEDTFLQGEPATEALVPPVDASTALPSEHEPDVDVTATLSREGIRSKELSYISLASRSEGRAREGHVYHIRPTGDGKWSLKREGAQKATKRFDQPRLAVARGLELAGENGKVFVHDLDGEVEMVFDAPAGPVDVPG